MDNMESSLSGPMGRNAKVLILIVMAIFMIRNAWMCDDAYITLRTVDNFVNGFGLRWNIADRVQTYTHPLWLLALSIPYAITSEPYFSTIVISLCFSLAAVGVVLFVGRPSLVAGVLVTVAMLMSKAFMDFTTSGLENPLSYLLVGGFVLVSWHGDEGVTPRTLFRSSLLFALLLINRMDLCILVGPLYGLLLYRAMRIKTPSRRTLVIRMIQGWLPFIAWELFSLVYYGFLFPNTAYAKLNTGVPLLEYLSQGGIYYLNAIETDPATLIVLLLVVVMFAGGRSAGRAVALGIVLFLLYILRVGGDFMATRFLSIPLFFACAALVRLNLPVRFSAGATALVLLVGLLSPYCPAKSDSTYQGYFAVYQAKGVGVNDERGFYYGSTGLLRAKKSGMPKHPWLESGERLRAQIPPGQRVVVEMHSIGMMGFGAGPTVHAIDLFALGDPLLARLDCFKDWRIGNFQRPLPAGYRETLERGSNQIWDAALRDYYARLQCVVSGPIWTMERLTEIVRFNVGANNHLLGSINVSPVIHIINSGDSNMAISLNDRILGSVQGKWAEYWRVPSGAYVMKAWDPSRASQPPVVKKLSMSDNGVYEMDVASEKK